MFDKLIGTNQQTKLNIKQQQQTHIYTANRQGGTVITRVSTQTTNTSQLIEKEPQPNTFEHIILFRQQILLNNY